MQGWHVDTEKSRATARATVPALIWYLVKCYTTGQKCKPIWSRGGVLKSNHGGYMDFVGRKAWHPKRQFVDLKEGDSIHGMSDGSWSFTDGILALTQLTGKCDLIVSTWTAAAADIKRAHKLLEDGKFSSARFLVDRSFLTRQPRYCELLRERFGDEAIRVWSAHAKFCLLIGGQDGRALSDECESE